MYSKPGVLDNSGLFYYKKCARKPVCDTTGNMKMTQEKHILTVMKSIKEMILKRQRELDYHLDKPSNTETKTLNLIKEVFFFDLDDLERHLPFDFQEVHGGEDDYVQMLNDENRISNQGIDYRCWLMIGEDTYLGIWAGFEFETQKIEVWGIEPFYNRGDLTLWNFYRL